MINSRPDPDVAPSGRWIALFLVAAVLLRFIGLATLSVWPLVDESVHGWIAMQCMMPWDGHLFHYVSQMPPLYFILLSVVFKATGAGLTSLWLLPALLSLLTCVAALWIARARNYPPVFQWAGVVMMLSFWPAYLGRFSHPAVLVPLFEVFGVALLYEWKRDGERFSRVAALGALTGLGFYTYLAWPVVALALGLGVAMLASPGKRLRSLGIWILVTAAVMAPLGLEAFRSGFGSYFAHLWTADKTGSSFWDSVGSVGRYIRVLWIGTDEFNFFYTPAWGGLWNPLVGFGILLGLAGMVHRRESPWARWALLCGALFLLPGILTVSLNPLRIVAWVPLGVALAAIGWGDVLERLGKRSRVWLLAALLAVSAGWDAYHLLDRYPRFWREGTGAWGEMCKSWKFKTACDFLSAEAKQHGRGFYLSGFQLEPVDQSLSLAASYWNSELGECSWAAFIANVNYRPFLEKRFAGLRVHELPPGTSREGGSILYVVPTPGEWYPVWMDANQAWMQAVSDGFLRSEDGSYAPVLKRLEESSGILQGDPMLESLLGEKLALIHALDSAYGTRDKRGNFLGSFQALRRAADRGYPAAHLWNELGSMYALAGKKAEAKACFLKARAAPLNRTPAGDNLKVLGTR